MVLHVFTSSLGGVLLCIPYGLYSGTSPLENPRRVSGSGLVSLVSELYVSKFLGVVHCCATHPVFCIPF